MTASWRKFREYLQTIQLTTAVIGVLAGCLVSVMAGVLLLQEERHQLLEMRSWMLDNRTGLEEVVFWGSQARRELESLSRTTRELKSMVESVFLRPVGTVRIVNFGDRPMILINTSGPAASMLSIGRSRHARDQFYLAVTNMSPPYSSTDRVLVVGTYNDSETRDMGRITPSAARIIGATGSKVDVQLHLLLEEEP